MSTWTDRDICLQVLEKHKNEKIKTIAEGAGLFYLLNSLGVKDLKAFVELRHSRPEWYRKRRLIATFTRKFAIPNESLITVVNNALTNDSVQLDLPSI